MRRLQRRRLAAVIMIQCCVRIFAAKIKVGRIRLRRQAAATIGYASLRWWILKRFRRRRVVIHSQRLVRGFLARGRVRRLMLKREIEHRLLRDREESERVRLEAEAELAAMRRVELHVVLGIKILKSMAAMGSQEVLSWSLQHCVLRYSNDRGLTLGTVLLQVVGAVEKAFPDLNTNASSGPAPELLVAKKSEMQSRSKGLRYYSQPSGRAKKASEIDSATVTSSDYAKLELDEKERKVEANVLLNPTSDLRALAAEHVVAIDVEQRCIKLSKWDEDDDETYSSGKEKEDSFSTAANNSKSNIIFSRMISNRWGEVCDVDVLLC